MNQAALQSASSPPEGLAPGFHPMETRLAPVASFDAEARTVEVVWTTGAAVRRRRYDWQSGKFVDYDEVLEVSSKAIDMTRLNAGAPALDSHDAWSTKSQVGVVEKAWIAGSEGRALIRFPKAGVDENADRIAAMVGEKIIRNVSVGYSTDRVRIEPPKKDGDVEKRVVEKWTPYEISFVTMGADPGAQTRGADEGTQARAFPIEVTRASPAHQEKKMTVETMTAEEARAAERKRLSMIDELDARHRLGATWRREMINSDRDELSVRSSALEILANRDLADAGGITSISDAGAGNVANAQRSAMEEALASIVTGRSMSREVAREMGGHRMIDVMAYHLRARGLNISGMSDSRIINATLQSRGGASGYGALNTGDFAVLLENVLNKEFINRPERAPSGVMQVAYKGSVRDFRDHNRYRGGAIGKLVALKEGGEVKSVNIPDGAKETIKADTRGGILRLTRQAMVNDDMGVFADTAKIAGEGVTATINSELVTIVESSPNMTDGVPAFHANHGNLASSGAALSETTLNEATLAIRTQTDINGEIAGLAPKFLLVPPQLETTGKKLLSTVNATQTADVNPHTDLQLVVEPRFTDAAAWYLVCDPQQVRGLEYAFLDGAEGGQIEVRTGWEYDAVEMRVLLDLGVAFIDTRGWFKNPGA